MKHVQENQNPLPPVAALTPLACSGFEAKDRVTDGEFTGTVVDPQGHLTLVYWDVGAQSTIETKDLRRIRHNLPASHANKLKD